ncbi:hypothetical protein BH23VER1_BH23VER1_21910 [soil metagenome]
MDASHTIPYLGVPMSPASKVIFSEFVRKPSGVARVVSAPLEASLEIPGPGQIRIRMRYASINRADINVMDGIYGSLPELLEL